MKNEFFLLIRSSVLWTLSKLSGKEWCGRSSRIIPAFYLALAAAFLSGCVSYNVNRPIKKINPGTGYRVSTLGAPNNSRSLWVVLAFSGGGTRSAAFSYGVLEELAKTEITWEGKRRRLLDEVDNITSVSGGSFTAAYYGLFRDRIFEDYERKFLKRNIQGNLLSRILSPLFWLRSFIEGYHRSDLAADYYDKVLFEGKTFADLAANGRPIIHINATDMTLGMGFTFNQNYFDVICSDISTYPISRAVTASSAFPVAFTPISIRNYAGNCDFKEPAWIKKELAKRNTISRRFHLAKSISAYLNPKKTKYIHLLDGGVADNLGLRATLRGLVGFGGAWEFMKRQRLDEVRRSILIVVDAKSNPEKDWSQQVSVSGIMQMLDASFGTQVDNFSFETLWLFEKIMNISAQEINAIRCKKSPNHSCNELKVDLIHISFDKLKDEAERKFFLSIPTSLSLPADTVDRLRGVAGKLLRESESYQKFLRETGGVARKKQ